MKILLEINNSKFIQHFHDGLNYKQERNIRPVIPKVRANNYSSTILTCTPLFITYSGTQEARTPHPVPIIM